MSKAVLISIKPKWCEKIASGEKTIEVRKTKPNIETPFKCYIYCTKDKYDWLYRTTTDKDNLQHSHSFHGKVIGEFICDNIIHIQALTDNFGDKHLYNTVFMNNTCLKDGELFNYLTRGSEEKNKMFRGYGYHITKLKIYNKPKELYTFRRCCSYKCFSCEHEYETQEFCNDLLTIKHPPQSWCYVEDLGD